MNLSVHTFYLLARYRQVLTPALLASAIAIPRIATADFEWVIGQPTASFKATNDLHFIRGDANLDGNIDISDPINVLFGLFSANGELLCEDAADANDDGRVDISDPIFVLRYLFAAGATPSAPFLTRGQDPTEDTLQCRPRQAADRWIFRIRPRVCTVDGCDPWLTSEDTPSREGHVAAFARWAEAGGAVISRIWAQDAIKTIDDREPFEIAVMLTGSAWVSEIIAVCYKILLAPPGVFAFPVDARDNDSDRLLESCGVELVGTQQQWRPGETLAVARSEISTMFCYIENTQWPWIPMGGQIFPRGQLFEAWVPPPRCDGAAWDVVGVPPLDSLARYLGLDRFFWILDPQTNISFGTPWCPPGCGVPCEYAMYFAVPEEVFDEILHMDDPWTYFIDYTNPSWMADGSFWDP